MSRNVVGVVLAAGRGTRMKSSLAKVLHCIAGRPMLDHVLGAINAAGVQRTLVVVGYQRERVAEHVGERAVTVTQAEQLGTGHAVQQVEGELRGTSEDVLVVAGDIPLITADILRELIDHHQAAAADATLMSAEVDDPTGYGRVVRTEEGSFARIVEQADIDHAGDHDLEHVREINTGSCVVRSEVLFDFLAQLETDNAQGEYYLVDIFELMSAAGRRVEVYTTADTGAVMGVNDRAALAEAACKLRQRTNERLMLAGVTIVDPANTYIESTVKVGKDTVIHPGTVLSGQTVVGEGCEIGPGTDMEDSVVGAQCSIVRSTVTSSSVGSNVSIGPYTHIRPGSELADEVRVGNYAEIKNSFVGRETKVSHHCYIGDADIGQRVNMGAGVVTVNYDGYEKHRTVIEDEAFIGCNVNLVAPVKVGSGAYVAAGSTLTDDVPEQSLAIARSRQDNRTDWVRRWRQRHEQGRS